MNAMHEAVHGGLALWGSFAAVAVVVTVAVTALALGAGRLSRRLSSRSRHFLLLAALIVPAAGVALVPAGAADAVRRFAAQAAEPSASGVVTTAVDAVAIAPGGAAGWAAEAACLTLALWAGGFLALAAWRSLEWARWRTLAAADGHEVDDRTRAAFRNRARGRATPELIASAGCAAPMVVGILRPRVVIPAGYGRGMTDEEIESAFEHELEHVARRDNLVAAVAEGICAAFWFDPLHWLARRRLVELREAACDEGVLARGCAAEPYVAALAKTGRASISPAVACMANLRIRERMEIIMTYPRVRSQWLPERGVRAAGVFALALAALGIALFAPASSLAVETDGHKLFVSSRPASNGLLLLDGELRTPDGVLVMNPRTTATVGSPVIIQTLSGGREYRLTMTVGADGHGTAGLEVLEHGVVIDSFSVAIAPSAPHRRPADKITLHLTDADVHDLARTFGALTGMKVSVADGLHGRVSVDAKDVPWPEALGQALASIGGRVLMRDDEVIFAPATGLASRAPAAPTPAGFETLRPGIENPQLITRVDPVYTPEAKAARIAGIVIVQAQVGTDGLVHGATVVKDLPFGLGQAAVDAVRQWTFAPALADGKPVPVLFNITVSFRLDDDEAPVPRSPGEE